MLKHLALTDRNWIAKIPYFHSTIILSMFRLCWLIFKPWL